MLKYIIYLLLIVKVSAHQLGDGNFVSTINGEPGNVIINAGTGMTATQVGKEISLSWNGTTNGIYSFWTKEDGTNVLNTTDGFITNKQYFSTNDLPSIGSVPIAVDLALANVDSGPGEYALYRVAGETTNYEWRIIRGQVSQYVNASYVWTPYGVTNKFFVNGTNEQTYTIPAGITQCVIKCFGAGGGSTKGGTGGSCIQPYSCIPGELLTLRVGNRGRFDDASPNPGGWPGGGSAVGHTGYRGGGGGGYTGVFSGTNVICIAGGGGGGNSNYSTGGNGGGLFGGDGGRIGGYGGSQSSGGANGGIAYFGGSNTQYYASGGGGGGYYGGGAARNIESGGGGGSGYVSTPNGYSYTGLLTGDADYEAGIGVAGGNGMIVILHDAP